MIPVLIETILRSAFVGLTIASIAALASLLLASVTKRWHSQSANSSDVLPGYTMTLLQELQAMLQARSGSGIARNPAAAPQSSNNRFEASRNARSIFGRFGPFTRYPATRTPR